jgi:hypothetical protein
MSLFRLVAAGRLAGAQARTPGGDAGVVVMTELVENVVEERSRPGGRASAGCVACRHS